VEGKMMELQDRIYLSASTSCIVLSICYSAYLGIRCIRDQDLLQHIKADSLLVSWIFFISPGLVLVIVFLVENAQRIYFREALKNGASCQFTAFIATLTLTSLNGSASTISYVSYLFAKSGNMPPLDKVIGGNLLSWLSGLAIAFIYLFGGLFGPYRELYCCVEKQYYKAILVAEIFLVFGFSALFQVFFYTSAFLECGKRFQVNNNGTCKTTLVILKSGLEMIFIFYISYFLLVADAAAVLSSSHPSIWLSGVAACMVKLEPFWQCLLLHRVLNRMCKHKARVSPYNPGQPPSAVNDKSSSSKVINVSLLQCLQSIYKPTSKKYSQHSVRRKKSFEPPNFNESKMEEI